MGVEFGGRWSEVGREQASDRVVDDIEVPPDNNGPERGLSDSLLDPDSESVIGNKQARQKILNEIEAPPDSILAKGVPANNLSDLDPCSEYMIELRGLGAEAVGVNPPAPLPTTGQEEKSDIPKKDDDPEPLSSRLLDED